MEIKNRELKIEMLDNFVYATISTQQEFAGVINFLPPYVRELKSEIILDLRLELENEAEITNTREKIKVLKALYQVNNEVLARKVPDNYDNKVAENKMQLNADLVLLNELIEELGEVSNNEVNR